MTAGFGWWVQRKQGLPSSFALTIRGELEAANAALRSKAERLSAELAEERGLREEAGKACDEQIATLQEHVERLTEAIVDRDLVISVLHRRLGLQPPKLDDPFA